MPAKPHGDDLHTVATTQEWTEMDGMRLAVRCLPADTNSTRRAALNHLEALRLSRSDSVRYQGGIEKANNPRMDRPSGFPCQRSRHVQSQRSEFPPPERRD